MKRAYHYQNFAMARQIAWIRVTSQINATVSIQIFTATNLGHTNSSGINILVLPPVHIYIIHGDVFNS